MLCVCVCVCVCVCACARISHPPTPRPVLFHLQIYSAAFQNVWYLGSAGKVRRILFFFLNNFHPGIVTDLRYLPSEYFCFLLLQKFRRTEEEIGAWDEMQDRYV